MNAELKADLIILLAENDYPPVDRDEVDKEIFEQAAAEFDPQVGCAFAFLAEYFGMGKKEEQEGAVSCLRSPALSISNRSLNNHSDIVEKKRKLLAGKSWLGDRDSNPDKRSQSPLSCH